jgi:hypothetical protein
MKVKELMDFLEGIDENLDIVAYCDGDNPLEGCEILECVSIMSSKKNKESFVALAYC